MAAKECPSAAAFFLQHHEFKVCQGTVPLTFSNVRLACIQVWCRRENKMQYTNAEGVETDESSKLYAFFAARENEPSASARVD